jgi:hypothetical protein
MTRSFIILAFFLFNTFISEGQKSIDGLIQAEKSFAAYSVSNSTKEAFLKFLDTEGIVFENGKAVNGIEAWNKREKKPGILNWHPQYAEITYSGDFGYTTGPWTFQNSKNDTVVARGQYATIWHINEKGEWKFLADLGVNYSLVNSSSDVEEVNSKNKFSGMGPVPHAGFDNVENDFVKLVSESKTKAYGKYLSEKSILIRNGYLPAVTSSDQHKIIELTPSSVQYKILYRDMTELMDMAYVYGTTLINGKTENYLRIWRWEKTEWKIALEVLRY